jgi:hypothetical protein
MFCGKCWTKRVLIWTAVTTSECPQVTSLPFKARSTDFRSG